MTGNSERLPPTLCWQGEEQGTLHLLDQCALPHLVRVLELRQLAPLLEAIVQLRVRGAPAIGVAAAYGMVLGVREQMQAGVDFAAALRSTARALLASRPTAVNLRGCVERVTQRAAREPNLRALWLEAACLHAEDVQSCAAMGACGLPLVPDGATVLTHCNTGRLATCGDGTALAVLFAAHRAGKRFSVLANETRPLLQGARLTALELQREGIPVQLLVDGAAPGLIASGAISMALVGADRIAANGDFANKVGTYGVALACVTHGVPFYVVAPGSTFDLTLACGAGIPIEQRDAKEVTHLQEQGLAACGVGARNPAFDLVPAHCVTAFVTDRGLLRPPFADAIKRTFASRR